MDVALTVRPQVPQNVTVILRINCLLVMILNVKLVHLRPVEGDPLRLYYLQIPVAMSTSVNQVLMTIKQCNLENMHTCCPFIRSSLVSTLYSPKHPLCPCALSAPGTSSYVVTIVSITTIGRLLSHKKIKILAKKGLQYPSTTPIGQKWLPDRT